jgi:glycosyltransferase involved in cell wall biosynthesis/ribosomal protein S18 acetylase RimI-like enzyme
MMTGRVRVAHVSTVDLTPRFLLLGQLRRLRDEGYDVTAVSAPGPWTADLEASGIRHIPWHHATRSWNLWGDLRAFAELLAILRRERFHLVHTHNPKPGVMGRIAARLAGVPCVVNTLHGLYATPEDRALKRLPVLVAEGLAARFSDFELYQSDEDLRWARRIRLVSPRKSALLGNGVDLTWLDPANVSSTHLSELRRELGIPERAQVVGTVGRLVAEKGYRELFAAARKVRAVMPEVRFLAVGGPDLAKADAIGEGELAQAREDVVVPGWREDIRDLLALMDVFVLPSWREGMPRSAIEAAAMGRASVLTDIRGCREVIRDGIEGLLVPPRRPDRLADAILRLLRDPAMRDRLGQAARARAVERFDERRVADTIVSLYGGLLTRKGLTPPGGQPEPSGPPRLRTARPADAAAMALIHKEIPGAFLTTLGDGFLRRLYRALTTDPQAVTVVAENGQGVVGFAAGVLSVGRFYRRFYLRRGLGAAFMVAPRLARPSTIRRLLETARYPGEVDSLPEAELLSIAVAPEARARGVGAMLADGIRTGLAARGVTEFKVVVDVPNEASNRMFARLGYERRARISVHHGTPSNVWVKRTQESEDR